MKRKKGVFMRSDFSGTYRAIFQSFTTAALFACYVAALTVCALAYFDILTK